MANITRTRAAHAATAAEFRTIIINLTGAPVDADWAEAARGLQHSVFLEWETPAPGRQLIASTLQEAVDAAEAGNAHLARQTLTHASRLTLAI